MLRNEQIVDDAPADEMLLDDPLERGRITLAIPGAFRIDNGDRPAFTDAKAIGLAAQDAALLGQAKLLQSAFQILPRGDPAFHVAALRLALLGAEAVSYTHLTLPTSDLV